MTMTIHARSCAAPDRGDPQGTTGVAVEHVGSTALPGLGSRRVLDLVFPSLPKSTGATGGLVEQHLEQEGVVHERPTSHPNPESLRNRRPCCLRASIDQSSDGTGIGFTWATEVLSISLC
jgi:GrpB-like predicted nucleotidyltransferase (UPF0157 family)